MCTWYPCDSRELRKQSRERNKERTEEWSKQYRIDNKEKVDNYKKQYRADNKEKISDYNKWYAENHKEEIKERKKRYRRDNKERLKEREDQYKINNKEKIKEQHKKYTERNKEKIKERRRENSQNPINRLHDSVRASIRQSLFSQNISKNRRKWEKLVGYSTQDLKEYLEKLFLPGMTWENYGKKWHIDHIIAKVFFVFKSTDDVEFKYCWSLYNLRPMWGGKNISKSDKIMLWGKEYIARYLERDYFSKLDIT